MREHSSHSLPYGPRSSSISSSGSSSSSSSSSSGSSSSIWRGCSRDHSGKVWCEPFTASSVYWGPLTLTFFPPEITLLDSNVLLNDLIATKTFDLSTLELGKTHAKTFVFYKVGQKHIKILLIPVLIMTIATGWPIQLYQLLYINTGPVSCKCLSWSPAGMKAFEILLRGTSPWLGSTWLDFNSLELRGIMDEHNANTTLQGAQHQCLPDGHSFSYEPGQVGTTVSLWCKQHSPQGFFFFRKKRLPLFGNLHSLKNQGLSD